MKTDPQQGPDARSFEKKIFFLSLPLRKIGDWLLPFHLLGGSLAGCHLHFFEPALLAEPIGLFI